MARTIGLPARCCVHYDRGMTTSAKGHVVLITGSREFDRADLIAAEIAGIPRPAIIMHGGSRGADFLASTEIHKHPGLVEVRVPYLKFHEKRGGHFRNTEMLRILEVFRDAGYECWGIAFHHDIKNPSPGTANMAKQLSQANFGVVHIDGKTL